MLLRILSSSVPTLNVTGVGRCACRSTRARALTAAVDVIIHPLLNVVEDRVGGAEVGGDHDLDELSGRTYTWQDVEARTLQSTLTAAAEVSHTEQFAARECAATQVSHLRLMMMDAGTAQYAAYKELGRWSGAVDVVTALLARLHAVWGAARVLPASAGTLASLFLSQSLNRLMGMLAVVYCRRVTLEGAAAVKRRTKQWRELCDAVNTDTQRWLTRPG